MKKLYIFIFVLILFNKMSAQNLPLAFKHIKVDQGLSQSWVKTICQDAQGFMWFGTNDGLNRYDGYTFTVYKHNPGNKHSLLNNTIESLYEDKNGNLWVGTATGLNLYDRGMDRFIHNPRWPQGRITDFLELEDGRLFVTSSTSGLYLFQSDKDSILTFNPDRNDPSGLSSNNISSILMDKNRRIWIGTNDGLNLMDTSNYTFIQFRNHPDDQNSISGNDIRSLYLDRDGRIWIGTLKNGLNLLTYDLVNSDDYRFTHFKHNSNDATSISDGTILSLFEDRQGNLWIGTENGGLNILDLKHFNKDQCVFYHYIQDPFNNGSISNNSIYSIYEDREGSIWIGTYGGGINFYNHTALRFSYKYNEPENPNSLSNNSINAILGDGDYVWIGTEGGLNRYNKKKNTFTRFTHSPNDNKSIGSNAVCALEKDSQGNLWIGTWAGGLNLYNRQDNSFIRFKQDPDNDQSIGGDNIFSILEDRGRNLWIGCMGGGLNLFHQNNRTFSKYMHQDDDPSSVGDDWIRSLYENSYGEIWVATAGHGADLFNQEKGRFIHFRHDSTDHSSISYNNAIVFFEDSKKNMWIGTGRGLNLFNREDSSFTVYLEEHGLPNNLINGILEDDHGNLWISTHKGISKFVNGIECPENPVFKNYDANDGLQGNEFRPRSCFKDEDGKMYFGGTNGFNVFHPDSIEDSSSKPTVVFTNFLLFNHPVEIGSPDSPLHNNITVSKRIVLSYKHSVISFEYAALNFVAPEKIQYAYMLEGFEQNWNYMGNQRKATYTNIDPGSYVLRVKATNTNTVWSEEGASIEIVVTPPFWQTWLFRILLVVCVVGATLTIFKFRIRSIENHRRELAREVEERTAELKKSNDELAQFTYVAFHDLQEPIRIISSYSTLLERTLENKLDDNTREFLDFMKEGALRMQKLIEGLLQYTQVTTKAKPFVKVNCNQIIRNVLARIGPVIETTKANVTADPLPIIHADTAQIETVFKNLLINGLEYVKPGQPVRIHISATASDHEWMFSIKDNGIGIEQEFQEKIFGIFKRLHTRDEYDGIGIGLPISKKIVERHGGRMWISSAPGAGSTFYFTIPLHP